MNLLDIAPATKTVALGSAAVLVSGLSLRKLTQLIVAYPELASLVTGGKVDVGHMLVAAPDAALAVFSLGVVGRAPKRWWQKPQLLMAGDEDLTGAFELASAGQQIEILGAIYDLTFKGSERAIPFLKLIVGPSSAPDSAVPSDQPKPETSEPSMPASSSG